MQRVYVPGDYQYRALNFGLPPQRFWHANKIDLLKDLGNFSKKDVVLDAGCGSGNLSLALTGQVAKMIGVDSNAQAISFAQSRARQLGLSNIDFCQSDLQALPFANESFTKIMLLEVVEHLDLNDYQKILLELNRVLTTDGLLFLTTPNKLSLWPLIESLLDTFSLVPKLHEQHILKFSPKEIIQIINNHGFQVQKAGTFNHLSPLVSLFSWSLAKKLCALEIKYFKAFGPIIWLVAKKAA